MKNKFNWEDPLLLSAQLTEEENMVLESAHRYARSEERRVGKEC